ncbi:MAG: hypothetical protein KC656_07375, partial [Myxococcales bacterium]|nr:hypothetical protein [Myxococcales bacterium]
MLFHLLACHTVPYAGPEPLEPLPDDPRLGGVVLRSVSERQSRFLIGAGHGGQAVADLRPVGLELTDEGRLEWQATVSRLLWLPDGESTPEVLADSIPADTQRLGTSLVERSAVLLGPYGIAVVEGGTTRTLASPPDPFGLEHVTLLPDGSVLAEATGAGWRCDATRCEPEWVDLAAEPLAYDEGEIVIAWKDAEEVCVARGTETPDCAALPGMADPPRDGTGSFVLRVPWQDPDAVQVLVDMGSAELAAVKAYTWSPGALLAGEIIAGSVQETRPTGALVAQGSDTVLVLEHPTPGRGGLPCGPSDAMTCFPRMNAVRGGAFVESVQRYSERRLDCDCDRTVDVTCTCIDRVPTFRVDLAADGTSQRIWVLQRWLDGVDTLYARDLPLPNDTAPFVSVPCDVPCPW